MRTPLLLAAAIAGAAFAQAQTPFTVNQLHALERVSSPVVSPLGDIAVYSVRKWTESTRKTDNHLEYVDIASGATKPLIPTSQTLTASSYSPVFSPNGEIVAFQGDDSNAIYQFNIKTGVVSVLYRAPVEISSFKWDPASKLIVFTAKTFITCKAPVLECTAKMLEEIDARGPNTAWIYTKLYVRHWDSWETEGLMSHLFSLPITLSDNGYQAAGAPVDLLQGQSMSSPVPPFDEGWYNFSPDGQTLAFTAELVRHDTAWKTGWRVYTVPLYGTPNLTWITNFTDARCQDPSFSPSGKRLGYLCMSIPGRESDRLVLGAYNVQNQTRVKISQSWDRSISGYTWLSEDRFIVDADEDGAHKLFLLNESPFTITELVKDGDNHDVSAVPGKAGTFLFSRDSLKSPVNAFVLTLGDRPSIKQLTAYNKEALSSVFISEPEKFYFTSPNGKDKVQAWLLKPIGFSEGNWTNAQFPLAFLIHGGPEGAWSDSWSYRWNPQLWASRGYAAVFVNPHGSSGFGQAFQEGVLRQWGGLPFQDLMAGNDYAQKAYPWIDGKRQCACGASYGGYMINWINGHDDRFNCLVVHDGVFSSMGMYYSSEEVFFNEAEFGPPPYTSQAARDAYEQWSPVNYVQNWKTPTLVIHGDKDFRIPTAEGLSAFTALQRKGIPSKLMILPLENHWTLNPPNSITWYQQVLGWLDLYTAQSKKN